MPPDPTVIIPQVSVPSTFRRHIEGGKGRTFPSTLSIKVPVYEQERFERRVYQAIHTATGTGAAPFSARFAAPEGFPSFRVTRIYVWNEATANRAWYVNRYVQLQDGTFEIERVSLMTLAGGICSPMLLNSGHIAGNTYAFSDTFIGEPFECYQRKWERNVIDTSRGDEFQIQTVANITNADVVKVLVQMEAIPDLAQSAPSQEGWTVSP